MRLATGIFIVVAVFLFAVSETAEMRGTFSSPDHPGKCVFQDLILSPGEKATSQSCILVICEEESFAVIQTCGSFGTPIGTTLGRQTAARAEHPECCAREMINA